VLKKLSTGALVSIQPGRPVLAELVQSDARPVQTAKPVQQTEPKPVEPKPTAKISVAEAAAVAVEFAPEGALVRAATPTPASAAPAPSILVVHKTSTVESLIDKNGRCGSKLIHPDNEQPNVNISWGSVTCPDCLGLREVSLPDPVELPAVPAFTPEAGADDFEIPDDVPEEVQRASRVNDVVGWLHTQVKLSKRDQIQSACDALREKIPVLKRAGRDLETRVDRAISAVIP
jgi:hypothetical protein